MNHEIKKPTLLLKPNGQLREPGYATHMNFAYNRLCAKLGPMPLKEWNFYQFQCGDYVLQMTLGHLSYIGQMAVTLMNIRTGKRILALKGHSKEYDRIEVKLVIENDPSNEKMVIATPFDKPSQFYLNYKENYYKAKGYARFGDKYVEFKNATGLLDWGRGVWPYTHEWYWGNLTSHILNKTNFTKLLKSIGHLQYFLDVVCYCIISRNG